VDSISTSISNTEGRLLLRLTAHALLQDMYRPGWYVTTVVYSDQLLDAVVNCLNAAAGPDGNSFVLKHEQQLMPLPAEDKAGLCGSMQIGRRNVGLVEYDDFASTKSGEVYVLACSRQPMLSIAAGLKNMPEVLEREKLLEVADRRASLEQQQEQQQQQGAGPAAAAAGAGFNAAAAAAAAAAASAAVQMPFELLVTTGGKEGSQEEVTTLFEVRIPAGAAAAAAAAAASRHAAAPAASCSSTAESSSAPWSAAPAAAAAAAAAGSSAETGGRVLAKALLSYRKANVIRAPVQYANGLDDEEQPQEPLPRMAPCLERIEVQGAWRGKGIGRRLLQVGLGQSLFMFTCVLLAGACCSCCKSAVSDGHRMTSRRIRRALRAA
jgi:GNAT superfamily N-acetyltransferase